MTMILELGGSSNPLRGSWETQMSSFSLEESDSRDEKWGQELFDNFKNRGSYGEPLFCLSLSGFHAEHYSSYFMTSQFLSFLILI
jgi:hypothetical protein